MHKCHRQREQEGESRVRAGQPRPDLVAVDLDAHLATVSLSALHDKPCHGVARRLPTLRPCVASSGRRRRPRRLPRRSVGCGRRAVGRLGAHGAGRPARWCHPGPRLRRSRSGSGWTRPGPGTRSTGTSRTTVRTARSPRRTSSSTGPSRSMPMRRSAETTSTSWSVADLSATYDLFGTPQDVAAPTEVHVAEDGSTLLGIGPGLTYDVRLVFELDEEAVPDRITLTLDQQVWRDSFTRRDPRVVRPGPGGDRLDGRRPAAGGATTGRGVLMSRRRHAVGVGLVAFALLAAATLVNGWLPATTTARTRSPSSARASPATRSGCVRSPSAWTTSWGRRGSTSSGRP